MLLIYLFMLHYTSNILSACKADYSYNTPSNPTPYVKKKKMNLPLHDDKPQKHRSSKLTCSFSNLLISIWLFYSFNHLVWFTIHWFIQNFKPFFFFILVSILLGTNRWQTKWWTERKGEMDGAEGEKVCWLAVLLKSCWLDTQRLTVPTTMLWITMKLLRDIFFLLCLRED